MKDSEEALRLAVVSLQLLICSVAVSLGGKRLTSDVARAP